ncbi:sterol desaturase family protein [Flavihumibacter rivuli]|uniref:sterol desaturase family protein n=1 Tax=Flavihumibacter rivuli TaxID=2838156 RepID=UPI001BDEF16C|nr:sterol desaturase family protein [Flavihumibacter rivuli]ULQ55590.1 sterol desaturase family protein [Flavihumibacter rivuli]
MDWQQYFKVAQLIGGRYFIIAGIAFLLGYVLLRTRLSPKKIQKRFPVSKDYLREIGFSIITISIFAFVPILLIRNPVIGPHTTFYTDIEKYGWPYFFLAFPIMLFMHDTYFYWTHRLMHHPRLFRILHLTHHKSTNPSPWAAYAFHPLEAIVEAGIVPVFLFTIPIHQYHLPLFFLFMITYNVYGHLGYELYPRGFSRHWLGKWINTSVNHNQHHQYFKGNYGLYFLIWDRIMGTIRNDYDQRFDEVKAK